MDTLPVIPPHEMVYLITLRVSDGRGNGAILRRLLWHEADGPHRATFDEAHAVQCGLDIPYGTRLCQPWAVVEGLMLAALGESLGL